MDRGNKAKFIVFGIIAVLFFIIILAFIIASKKRGKKEATETVVHSQVDSNFTLDDMLKVNGQSKQTQTKDYDNTGFQNDTRVYQQDDDAVRLQKRIQESKAKEDSAIVQYRAQLMKTVKEIQETEPNNNKVPVPTVSEQISVTPINNITEIDAIETLEPEQETKPKGNRFYKPSDVNKILKNTVMATVHGEQILSNGSTLKMRLLENLETGNGIMIPKGSYIYGIVRLTGERMTIEIRSGQVEQLIYPLKMKVYDTDGLAGIKVPTNLKYELATELTEAGLNEARMSGSSGGIVDQGLNAVVNASSRVFRKSNRVVKIKIKSNYKLYLKDEA